MRPALGYALTITFAVGGFASLAVAAELTREPLSTVKQKVDEEKAVIVDVREKAEWDRGHVEGAILLPLSSLQRGISPQQLAEKLPEGKVLYLHCAVGRRAVTAGKILEQHGFEVRSLSAGYRDLIGAGFKGSHER